MKKKILLFEPDGLLRNTLREQISLNKDFEVTTVDEFEDVKYQLKLSSFDLIIMSTDNEVYSLSSMRRFIKEAKITNIVLFIVEFAPEEASSSEGSKEKHYFIEKPFRVQHFNKKISSDLDFKKILYIGLFQTLALIPGVSRAGVTITIGRMLKFNRYDSSKISFLLAIPALTGASVLSLKDILNQSFEINYFVFLSIVLSFLFSYFTVKFFLKYINKFSLNIFIIYRIIVAFILFIIIYY